MSIKRVAAGLVVVPFILGGTLAYAGPCEGTTCPQSTAVRSPLDSLKALFGASAEQPPQPARAKQAPPRASARKQRKPAPIAIPLPRARPQIAGPVAFPPDVFAAVEPDPAEDGPQGPARLVDEAFNIVAAHDSNYAALRSAMDAFRAQTDYGGF